MNNKSNNTRNGIGFIGLLTLLFIALRLTNVIDWPWIWVLSPLWVFVCVYAILFVVIINFFTDHKPKNAVYCRKCIYSGTIYSDGFGCKIHCKKHAVMFPTNHYCLEGKERSKSINAGAKEK